jgi:hypothetical protein
MTGSSLPGAIPVRCLSSLTAIFSVKSSLVSDKGYFMVGGRPRFWITLLILLLILIPVGLGQWDVVLAVIIGLTVGNGIAFLRGD